MKLLLLCLFLQSLTKQGFSLQCYTNEWSNDALTDETTCSADELCYEVASIKENSNECVYRRGCIQEPIQFPDRVSKKHFIAKEGTQNGLFRVCADDKCNNHRDPEFPCKPKDTDNTITAGTNYWMIGFICISILLLAVLLVGGGVYHKQKRTSSSSVFQN